MIPKAHKTSMLVPLRGSIYDLHLPPQSLKKKQKQGKEEKKRRSVDQELLDLYVL
jgi:hypothetical protein